MYYATLEHVLPRSRGGWNFIHNLFLACKGCNSRRGAKSLQYFYNVQLARGLKPRLNILQPISRSLGMPVLTNREYSEKQY